MSQQKVALYASVGPVLTHYDVDVDNYSLTKREALTLPQNVQYVWRHSSLPVLYVAASSRARRFENGADNFLYALKIDEATGELSIHGEPLRLPQRCVHVSTDNPSRHVLLAFNIPSHVMVVRIQADATLGEPVPQRADIDLGIFPHQIRVTPDNRLVVLVTRGNPGEHDGDKQKDPGALKIFEYRDGMLGKETSVTVGDGLHYGPRHVDFDPDNRCVYASLELQNQLYVHKRKGETFVSQPAFTKDTLADPANTHGHQAVGTIHMHPNGRVVYCINRGHAAVPFEGQEVVIKPDNTLAVYSIDPASGEPRLLQHIDSAGLCARTFSIDPSGRMLVAAHTENFLVKQTDNDSVKSVPANLAVFRVLEDGRLEFKRRYEVEVPPNQLQFWAGMVAY